MKLKPALAVLALAGCASGELAGSADITTTSTTTTTVPSVTDACRDALDKADDLIALSLEALQQAGDGIAAAGAAMTAASNLDIVGMENAADDLGEVNDWVRDHTPDARAARDAYNEAKDACLA